MAPIARTAGSHDGNASGWLVARTKGVGARSSGEVSWRAEFDRSFRANAAGGLMRVPPPLESGLPRGPAGQVQQQHHRHTGQCRQDRAE